MHVGLLCVTADGLSWIPEAVGRNELGGYKNKARTVARRKGCLSLSSSFSDHPRCIILLARHFVRCKQRRRLAKIMLSWRVFILAPSRKAEAAPRASSSRKGEKISRLCHGVVRALANCSRSLVGGNARVVRARTETRYTLWYVARDLWQECRYFTLSSERWAVCLLCWGLRVKTLPSDVSTP